MQQTNTPLLSVIIPVYNARNTLRECLDSVCGQTLSDLEILCVDDGSTDESVELLQELARKDGRIRVIVQSNRSAGAARNNGLSHARGKYVHFLDADDRLCPGIYGRAVERLEQTGAAVCMFQYKLLDGATGRETLCPNLLNGRERVTTLRREPAFFLYNMVAPWNKVYRRVWLEEHRLRFDEIVCGNDRGFYFRMLAAGGEIALSMDYGVSYRVNNAASLTGGGRWRHFDSLFYAWDSAETAMAGEEAPLRAMLLDGTVRDLLGVYSRTPEGERPAVCQQLRRRLERADLSLLKALPHPCVWREQVDRILAGEIPEPTRPGLTGRLKEQWAACKIWGIRGRVVKALAGKRTVR